MKNDVFVYGLSVDSVSTDKTWQCNGQEFRPGMTVKVVRIEEDFAPHGMGEDATWSDVWVHKEADSLPYTSMDEAVGLEFEIDYIDSEGVHFVEHTGSVVEMFAYPLSVLEVVKKEVF